MKIITSFAPTVHVNECASIEKRTKRLLKTQSKEVYRADLESASPEYKSSLGPVSFYSRRVRDNFGTVCTVRGNKRNVSPGFRVFHPDGRRNVYASEIRVACLATLTIVFSAFLCVRCFGGAFA
jgi:hypothetical protein